MVVASASSGMPPRKKREKSAAHLAAPKTFYASKRLIGRATNSGSVAVSVSVSEGDIDFDLFKGVAEGAKAGTKAVGKAFSAALKDAAAEVIQKRLGQEIEAIAGAYRNMLTASLATEPNPAVAAALNQARLQSRILEGTAMLDQAEACEILGLSKSNPSATMSRKEERGEVLRFTVEGRAVYPLFQFDVSERRIYPAMGTLLKAKPADWSDFRLMHWMTRPNLDLGGAPSEALAEAPDDVLAAFQREIEPVMHG